MRRDDKLALIDIIEGDLVFGVLRALGFRQPVEALHEFEGVATD